MAEHGGITGEIWIPDEFICQAIPVPDARGTADAVNQQASDTVTFPQAYYRLFDRNGFAFPAEYHGRPIRCIVSCESLVNHYGAKSTTLADAEAVFLRNLMHFQDAAKSLIQQHNSQAGTEVIIG
jgi:hypothetical protein